jgi:glutathione peroxidase-family protein
LLIYSLNRVLLKVSLDKYKGKPTLIVNVATNCSLTKNNYKQLNELYDKYSNEGLKIAAFPCNQFAGQEPGCDTDIKEFAKKNNVKFDMYSKIDVNGIYINKY